MKRQHRPASNYVAQPSPTVHLPVSNNALAIALHQSDWERAALLLMLGIVQMACTLPHETIDDVLTLLDGDEERDGDR
jgi:hypothetical protein